jgi:hypothetical protein
MPTFGANSEGVFTRLVGEDLVLRLITTRVFGLLVFFLDCASTAMHKSGFSCQENCDS